MGPASFVYIKSPMKKIITAAINPFGPFISIYNIVLYDLKSQCCLELGLGVFEIIFTESKVRIPVLLNRPLLFFFQVLFLQLKYLLIPGLTSRILSMNYRYCEMHRLLLALRDISCLDNQYLKIDDQSPKSNFLRLYIPARH